MPSETEQLKVTVSLINENTIVVTANSHEEFQKYTTNGQDQKDKRTMFCMLDDKLLRIQINNISNQEDNTNRLEVKSVSIHNDTTWGEEAKGVGKITKLLDFSETDKSKEIEIFKSLGSKVKKLAGEKGELQTQLNEAEQKNKELEDVKEDAKQQAESRQQELLNQLTQANIHLENAKKEAEKKQKDLETANQQKDKQIATLQKDLAAKNTEVQKLQKENKELEAKKQPAEQSKAPTYTAAVGVGLAAGLAVFIALEYTAKLEMLVTAGIAVASALAISGGTYLALKPSTQVSETQEPQNANVKGCCKA